MMTRRFAGILATALLVVLGGCSKKTPTLNLLVWEGYADPSFVQTFEEANHCKVCAVAAPAITTSFRLRAMWQPRSRPVAWRLLSI